MPNESPAQIAAATALALVDQFIASLETPEASQAETESQPLNHPTPSHLLNASAVSLKSAVTRVSLLTITAPFTPSAVTSTIQPLNTSILPSLVTAALLTSSTIYPRSFVKECNTLTRAALRDLRHLLLLVKARSEDDMPSKEVTDLDKKNITEATGRVWERCDSLTQFANEWVVGFVCRKAGQWLELMKDAVKEFQDWDPAEEIDDSPFDLEDIEDSADDEADDDSNKEKDRVAMSAAVKDQALKVLSRIPQSIHVVIKQRLAKMPQEDVSESNPNMVPMPTNRRSIIDRVLKDTRRISDSIDESAEGMYMGDLEKCLKKAGEARALTIDVVETVLQPWETSTDAKKDADSKEDQYVQRALAWIQQVRPDEKQLTMNNDVVEENKS